MRSRVVLSLLFMIVSIGVMSAQAPMPRLTTVAPDTGKAGDVLTGAGENLDKAAYEISGARRGRVGHGDQHQPRTAPCGDAVGARSRTGA